VKKTGQPRLYVSYYSDGSIEIVDQAFSQRWEFMENQPPTPDAFWARALWTAHVLPNEMFTPDVLRVVDEFTSFSQDDWHKLASRLRHSKDLLRDN
jgi:hypothetical protein